ncbi:MAG: hypothetical protein R6U37_08535 [Dehalococcoidia bacterium]
MVKNILSELRGHAPFTAFGASTGIIIMVLILVFDISSGISESLFEAFHPIHVLLSAIATTAMYKLHASGKLWKAALIGYTGSIGIATLSDCIIPYVGELMIGLPDPHPHIGFIEKWWIVNPLALAGIAIGYLRPVTRFPHAGHVLISAWASLFHITMALEESLDWILVIPIFIFLILAVLVPCCTSDIVYPLLFSSEHEHGHAH